MSSCCATRRASSTSAIEQQPVSLVAAPQPHRDADHVVAGGEQLGGGDRRVDAAAHRARAPSRCAPVRGCAGRRRSTAAAARSTSASVVVRPSVSRSAPPAHVAVDAHRGEHVRRLHRAGGARRRGAGAHPGLVEQVQQRLVLDAVDAHVREPGTLCVARHGLAHVGERCRQIASTSRSRSAADARRSRRRARRRSAAAPRPARRCRRRSACRCAARAPARRR